MNIEEVDMSLSTDCEVNNYKELVRAKRLNLSTIGSHCDVVFHSIIENSYMFAINFNSMLFLLHTRFFPRCT